MDGVSDGDEDMEVGVNNDEGMDVSSGEDKGVEVVENEDKDKGGDAHKSNEPEDMDIRNNDKECLCRICLLHDALVDTFWVQCICNRWFHYVCAVIENPFITEFLFVITVRLVTPSLL